jgi:hypothetical protein
MGQDLLLIGSVPLKSGKEMLTDHFAALMRATASPKGLSSFAAGSL